jgi:hypothetical protein
VKASPESPLNLTRVAQLRSGVVPQVQNTRVGVPYSDR